MSKQREGWPTQSVVRPGRNGATWLWRRLRLALGPAALVAVGSTSCSLDSLLNSDTLPPDVSDPAITHTPEGARAAYHGTLAGFYANFGGRTFGNAPYFVQMSFVVATGLLSDEMSHRPSSPNPSDQTDRRLMPEGSSSDDGPADSYSGLQKARGRAGQAIGLLNRYVPDEPALAGHLYAIAGYAEVLLAELFCSGIPLSTVDFEGDFTYRAGSTTTEVLTHAKALFDTALTLAVDSARIMDLARVGRARALVGLGRYAEAAASVAPVLDDYHYDAYYNNATSGSASAQSFAVLNVHINAWSHTVADREGANGLDYRTSGDPRTRVTPHGTDYHPDKYATDGSTPIVIASGVEARLIEAEAALRANPDDDVWLAKLNHLRQIAWPTIRPAIDTALSELEDPIDPDARVDLLFRERAFWLFLTGHRQGDLRRLVRSVDRGGYGRSQSQVYPVGAYRPGMPYGSDITAPIPTTEFTNPLYTGCASRGA